MQADDLGPREAELVVAAQVTGWVQEDVEPFMQGDAAYPAVVASRFAHHEVGTVVAELAGGRGQS